MGNKVEKIVKGGAFLIEELTPEQLFTPEDYTDEHKMIYKTSDDFVKKEVLPQVEYLEKHEFDRSVQLLKKAGELGLLGADVPEDYGGLGGLDKISSSLIAEAMSQAGGFSISHGAHVGIGSLPIVLFGNEEQKQAYLPALATGEKLAAYALTEPGSGSDALGAKTTARLNEAGTHYLLNGEKQWITNSAFADVFIVYAKIDGEHFSAFIVERDFSGVSTGPEEKKMGIKSSSTRTLILEDAEVPVENLLGEAGKGHRIAFNILNIGRYKLGVGAVGGSKRALEITLKYANQRKQFQTPISQFNLTKEKFGTLGAELYAAESSVYRTVGLFEEKMSQLTEEEVKDGSKVAEAIREYAIECSLNKFFASEVLDHVVDEGVQIHGIMSWMKGCKFTEAMAIWKSTRLKELIEIRGSIEYLKEPEGTNEINRLLVPGTFLKMAFKGELPLLEKAQTLQEELMMLMPEEPGDEPLEQERYLVTGTKKVALMIAGLGAQKFGPKLEQEQEILSKMADVVSLAYAMESVVVRTEKAITKTGVEKNKQKLLYTEIFCQNAIAKVEQLARESLAAIEEGDTFRMMN